MNDKKKRIFHEVIIYVEMVVDKLHLEAIDKFVRSSRRGV